MRCLPILRTSRESAIQDSQATAIEYCFEKLYCHLVGPGVTDEADVAFCAGMCYTLDAVLDASRRANVLAEVDD
jgi:hypothetical protein